MLCNTFFYFSAPLFVDFLLNTQLFDCQNVGQLNPSGKQKITAS